LKTLAELDDLDPADQLKELQKLLLNARQPEEKASLLLGASSSCTRLGKISEAREYWVEAKKLVASPSSLDPFLLHADAYITMCEGEHEDSREKYEASIRKFEELLTCKEFFADEENRDIQLDGLCQIAFLKVKLGRFKEAIPLLKQAVESNLSDDLKARATYFLGIAFYHQGLLSEAKDKLQNCEAMGGKFPFPRQDLYEWLAAVCSRLSSPAEAAQYRAISKIQ